LQGDEVDRFDGLHEQEKGYLATSTANPGGIEKDILTSEYLV